VFPYWWIIEDHPASIQWVPGVKWLECEADHSPTSSAEVQNAWNYTLTPQCVFMMLCLTKQDYVFMAWCFVKCRENFTCTLPVKKCCVDDVFI